MTDIQQAAQIQTLQKIPDILREADIEPSARLLEAVTYAKAAADRSAVPRAQKRLREAAAEEFSEAANELARAYAVEVLAWDNLNFQQDMQTAKFRNLFDALFADEGRIFEALCINFNALVPKFSEAVGKLPNMEITSTWQLGSEDFENLNQATTSAAEMRRYWRAYNSVSRSLGYLTANKQDGFGIAVFQLGEPASQQAYLDAARQLSASHQVGINPYSPLDPFVTLVHNHIPVNLIHPADAAERNPVGKEAA
ncbi:hypothetical protein [Saccharopolyspora sp. SCSIO 74807]|uniref:hypothetical protein n=1 Tax=Saccharopolyspora sp. SCSIO 74807 TaxID=3118084 RepID=UPI0030CE7642